MELWTIRKSEVIKGAVGIILILGLTLWSSSRGFDGSDTATYLKFYSNLLEIGALDIRDCQSFEPVFCVASWILVNISSSQIFVHYFLVFLYFFIVFVSFNLIHKGLEPKNRKIIFSIGLFVFISINYVDPQAIFFLTRQYLSAAIITLAMALIVLGRSPGMLLIVACLVHFGAIPIALILYLITAKVKLYKIFFVFFGLLVIGSIISQTYVFEVYQSSVQHKINAYLHKSDGVVTLVQEFRLVIYWFFLCLFFSKICRKLALACGLIYVFYLLTMPYDLFHLRYFKFLESLAWPGIMLLFFMNKRFSFCVLISLLGVRINRYLLFLI